MNAIEMPATNESPEIIKSARYLDSCGLHSENHKVRQAFVDVLEHVDDLGVESSWTGETEDCVVLGDDGFYA